MTREHLTVLIPTFNNAKDIVALLDDVSWASEILVVDSFSTDETVRTCRERGAKVVQHTYENSAKQKNWAIPQCAHPWVLLIDTDERLPKGLQSEILALMTQGIPEDCDAYRIARKNMILGEWIKAMDLWPDYQTRLFRRDVGRYEDKEVHADIEVPGRLGTLTNALVHNGTDSLSKQISLLDRYSSYKATEFRRRGRRFRTIDLLVRPLGAFFYLFVLRQGFKEGIRGLFLAFHTMAFSFFTYAKLWEKELSDRRGQDIVSTTGSGGEAEQPPSGRPLTGG